MRDCSRVEQRSVEFGLLVFDGLDESTFAGMGCCFAGSVHASHFPHSATPWFAPSPCAGPVPPIRLGSEGVVQVVRHCARAVRCTSDRARAVRAREQEHDLVDRDL